ncbi:MAG TPA: PQQ-binding-like beta-propeller repeat protein [Pyrinomonadaceae bacterium]|jgi:outer membrane protein assembly factor BamB|nr:PQQ-binding-like beta-propeller repeat protein [Pyrinomonadaceae bacterium]
MSKLRVFYMLFFVFSAATVVANAQDWTQWRGPARDGSVLSKYAPASWPPSLKQSWRVEIGEGYSSPVVAGGKVFVLGRRDPEEIVASINLADGKVLWQQKYQAEFKKNQYAVEMAKGPNATPLVAGNRLFTLGVTGIVNAWDTATGKQLWTRDFSKSIDTSKMFCGTAASPLIVNGRLVVQIGSDIHGGQVLGLNPATGATEWEWRGLGPGYASPMVIELGGSQQIVTMTESSIVSLDGKTGKELWSVPFPDEWHENIATPLWTGAHLVVSGTRQGTHAYALAQTGGKWQATESWKNPDIAMYMSSPVFGDGLIYGHSSKRKGQFFAIDAKTGAVRWATEGREGEHASLLLTPQHVVILTNSADLIVAKRGTPAFTVERRYEVAQATTFASPVILGTNILVRDATGLTLLTF